MEMLTSEHGDLAQKSARFGTAHSGRWPREARSGWIFIPTHADVKRDIDRMLSSTMARCQRKSLFEFWSLLAWRVAGMCRGSLVAAALTKPATLWYYNATPEENSPHAVRLDSLGSG